MLFIATLLLFFGRVFGQVWVPSINGIVPPDALQGSTNENGQALYICRVFFKTEICAGKLARSGDCLIPYFKEEHALSVYSVLTVPPWEEYTLAWSDREYRNGAVPENAVSVGSSGIYVGRYNWRGQYFPGKIVQRHDAFFYGYNGGEYETENYEVLLIIPRSVDHYELRDVVYDISSISYDLSPKQVTLSQKSVTNNSPYDTTSLLSMAFADSKTSEWSQMNGFEVHEGKKISVSAEIPYIGSASGEVEFGSSESSSYTQGGSYETSETTTHELTVNLPAYSDVTVSMLAKKGTASIPYTGTLRVVFTNRQYYDQAGIEGIYTGVQYTSFDTSIKSSTMKPDGNGGIKAVSTSSLWMTILFLSLYINTLYT